MMKNLLTVLLTVLFFVLAGCSSKSLQTPISNSQPALTIPPDYAGKTIPSGVDVSAGADLFKTDCVTCHGDSGHGDGTASQSLVPPPANLVNVGKSSADDFLFWKISTGVDGTAMPAWKGVITDQQIWQVVAFIRMLK